MSHFDDARLHVRKLAERDRLLNRRRLHGKGVAAALKMIVAQDRAAYDGQIGIAADKIVRKLLDKVQQLAERSLSIRMGVCRPLKTMQCSL